MNELQELRTWIKLELKEAKNNIRLSQSSPEGFYYLHNKGRESTLRKVLDKIDVLLSKE